MLQHLTADELEGIEISKGDVRDSDAVRQAFKDNDNDGVMVVDDYRGIPVVSAYGPFTFHGVTWAVMAEIDREEIAVDAAADRPKLTGILLFFFSLSVWSVWYWRGRNLSDSDSAYAHLDLELNGGDFADSSG